MNWCPELGTVLANEEVIDGLSERGGFPVIRKVQTTISSTYLNQEICSSSVVLVRNSVIFKLRRKISLPKAHCKSWDQEMDYTESTRKMPEEIFIADLSSFLSSECCLNRPIYLRELDGKLHLFTYRTGK